MYFFSVFFMNANADPSYYLYEADRKTSCYFMYDSLKRLRRVRNPEQNVNTPSLDLVDGLTGNSQWSMGYTYDDDSNLSTRTDARGITTTYNYDALNRITSRSYGSDPNTAPVTYTYDAAGVQFSKGRLTRVSSSVSVCDYLEYDQLGRIKQSRQTTDGQSYLMSYDYNLAGAMTSETYPGPTGTGNGRVVKTEYDPAGRIAGIKDQAQAFYYAGAAGTDSTNRIQYTAHGAATVTKLGNGKWEHTSFNTRLQRILIGLGTSSTDSSISKLEYGYGTTSNNGNVLSQTITITGLTVNQCYGYDSLNRLSTAEERSGGTVCAGTQQWKQAFSYDRFGNRNFDVANTTSNVLGPNPSVNQTDNRFTAGQSYGYDDAGNLTGDPTTPVDGIVYDAENRQTQYTKTAQPTNFYYYDGDGHRVKKIDSTGTTVFVYNVSGQLIAEYTSGPPSGSGTSYLTSDHLASTRVVMKPDGSVARHDYLPFGEEIQGGIGGRTEGLGYVADTVRQKFTQKERDSESGLDYFGARYFSSAQGRFTSTDPLGHWMIEEKKRDLYFANPQRWNRYVFVLNNPLRFVDPDGLAEVAVWAGLTRAIQDDLLKHGITNKIWDAWSSDQRQQVINFRARMATAGLWNEISRVMFVSVNSDGKTTTATIEPEPWKNFILAFTTKSSTSDFRRMLDDAGITRDKVFKHKEAEWSHHEGGGISIHVLGFKPPANSMNESHFDAGGGNWWNPEHIFDAMSGSGPTHDRVTHVLAQNPDSLKYLRGFGTEVDKLLTKDAQPRREPVK